MRAYPFLGVAGLCSTLACTTLSAEPPEAAAARRWSFANDVEPVLTKAGCNSGACHGAAAGKNGFKLSLRGYDPFSDYLTLTRQGDARRVNRRHPDESLMLLKPLGKISHGGGKRLEEGSLDHTILKSWILSGADGPGPSDPKVESLVVEPKEASLAAGGTQKIQDL